VRVLVDVDIDMKVVEGGKKNKEEVACTVYIVFYLLTLPLTSEVFRKFVGVHSLIIQNI
jgi:hypothetical protein